MSFFGQSNPYEKLPSGNLLPVLDDIFDKCQEAIQNLDSALDEDSKHIQRVRYRVMYEISKFLVYNKLFVKCRLRDDGVMDFELSASDRYTSHIQIPCFSVLLRNAETLELHFILPYGTRNITRDILDDFMFDLWVCTDNPKPYNPKESGRSIITYLQNNSL
jgi:hypothetical protein